MSVFTQFTTNTTPFGQLIPLWDTKTNPTIDGVEYLRTGTLKSSTGYSSLVSNYPSLGLNVPTGSSYAMGSGSAGRGVCLTDGTRYYYFSSNSISYGTSVTSAWTATISLPQGAPTDACRFGTSSTLLYVQAGNVFLNYLVGTTATAVNTTNSMYVCASNTAGTLAVMVGGTGALANNIWTSTNGTSWTSRTPSGAAGRNVYKATWSPVANAFIYIDTSFEVYTTTDGFTLTSRGFLSGFTGSMATASYNAQTASNASSPTSTLMAFQDSQTWITRTTNGTSYTTSSVASLFGPSVPTNVIPRLQYMNGAYYAEIPTGYLLPQTQVFKSTDDGVTWSPVANIAIPPYTATGSNNYALDQFVVLNGNIIAIVYLGNTNYYAVLSSYDTANFIGVPYGTTLFAGASTALNGNQPNYYVRIK